MPPSRLRETTSAGGRDPGLGVEIVTGPRATRNQKKSYVVESSSSEEEDYEEEQDEYSEVEGSEDEATDMAASKVTPNNESGEESEESVDEEEEEEEDADADADADGDVDVDAYADGDIDMEDDDADDGLPLGHRPAPILKVNGPAPPKPTVMVTPAQDSKIKSVEAKEMEMEDDDDDEELSDLDSNEEEEEQEEEDAEGEEVDEMEEDGDRSLDEEGSRASTPDISKMTKRQRSRFEQVETNTDFLQLPMEPQIKKHLTAEEQVMRRSEMARRRKNLSEKRNEEEKMDTINRLLKKQAPKRRGKISAAEIQAQDRGDSPTPTTGDQAEEVEVTPANPIYVRWVSNSRGSRLGVPSEWLDAPVGRVFSTGGPRKMVQEVEG